MRVLATLALSLVVALPTSGNAQFSSLSLSVVPEFPAPRQSVEVSLNDYSVNAVGATIQWYIDNAEAKEYQNERAITLKAGDLGHTTSVRALLTRNNGSTLSATETIVPTAVDIILEADTYVPAFYRGRRLPSAESTIRAIAVVHGGTTAAATYSYKWTKGSEVLSGGPVKGKNAVEFTLSRYDTGNLEVEVIDPSGATMGKSSVALKAVAPELHFYENSALRGLFEKEVLKLPLIGEEATVYGEPYFLNIPRALRSATFAWKINGVETSSGAADPNAITLRRTGGAGEASIGLSVTTSARIPQFIEKAFALIF